MWEFILSAGLLILFVVALAFAAMVVTIRDTSARLEKANKNIKHLKGQLLSTEIALKKLQKTYEKEEGL